MTSATSPDVAQQARVDADRRPSTPAPRARRSSGPSPATSRVARRSALAGADDLGKRRPRPCARRADPRSRPPGHPTGDAQLGGGGRSTSLGVRGRERTRSRLDRTISSRRRGDAVAGQPIGKVGADHEVARHQRRGDPLGDRERPALGPAVAGTEARHRRRVVDDRRAPGRGRRPDRANPAFDWWVWTTSTRRLTHERDELAQDGGVGAGIDRSGPAAGSGSPRGRPRRRPPRPDRSPRRPRPACSAGIAASTSKRRRSDPPRPSRVMTLRTRTGTEPVSSGRRGRPRSYARAGLRAIGADGGWTGPYAATTGGSADSGWWPWGACGHSTSEVVRSGRADQRRYEFQPLWRRCGPRCTSPVRPPLG